MILMKSIQIDSLQSLKDALQTAIELEHATIPPYLTAKFTLFNTGNDEISNLIGSVLIEEMLHLSIACNIMNAIGGNPAINKPDFIPQYPGNLPGGVESSLIVPLEKFSKDLIKNVFMVIEEPSDPIKIPVELVGDPNGVTIGQFYDQIRDGIIYLEDQASCEGKTIFTGDKDRQMTYEKFYPASELFPITDQHSALRGIEIIKDQGEGTTTDPFVSSENDGDAPVQEPAHYYRFEEIYAGKTLRKDSTTTVGYSYSGTEIPFDPTSVPNMRKNPKMDNYPKDSVAYQNSRLFNIQYTSLLNSLHDTFNGNPEQINTAMGLMFSLRLYALKLLSIPDPNNPGYTAGPSFEYISEA